LSTRKYEDLLADKRYGLWLADVARGSLITADVYRRRMGWFCELHGTAPAALVCRETADLRDLLLETVGQLESEGRSGGYIASVLKAVRSWLSFNGITFSRPIRVTAQRRRPTLEGERVPTADEVASILRVARPKTRAICVLMGESGLRPQVLGNYYGTDGLRLGDLPELRIRPGRVGFVRTPALVTVRETLSKKRHKYLTFLSGEGCSHLEEYLSARLRAGEELHEGSPVITPPVAQKPFIRTTNISDAVRLAIRRAGFAWRPYVLRSYFATRMMRAESRGFLIRDYRVFFMGHVGDIEAVYTLHKTLPEEVIEEMRDAYARSTAPGNADGQRSSRPSFEQQLVPYQELEARLAEGWRFLALLPDERAVIQRGSDH
jgi:integrase